MKKQILLSIAILFTTVVFGQTVKTDTLLNTVYVNVNPYQPNEDDTTEASKICFSVYSDNLYSSCTLTVQWYTSGNVLIRRKSLTMSGDDYKNWDSSNEYLATFIQQHYTKTSNPIILK